MQHMKSASTMVRLTEAVPRSGGIISNEMLRLTWPQAAAWRIWRHHLDERAPASSMLAVVSRLCGLHAQVMSSARRAQAQRSEPATQDR